jgi:putative MATE family efflux protein
VSILTEKKTEENLRSSVNPLHGSLWDKILRFSIPLAVTGILQQLFNAADTVVVGQFAGKNAMAAVGSDGPVISILVNLFIGLSVGANVVIANCVGRGDNAETNKSIHTSVFVGLACGLFIMIVGLAFSAPLLNMMSVPHDIHDMALLYLRLYFTGMPFIMMYNFESAIFRSQGNTRTPLAVLTISGILNIGLNLLFVLLLGMDVAGVALATVISNAASSAILFSILVKHKGPTQLKIREMRFNMRYFNGILRIGLPAGIQSMVFSVSNLLIQSSVNQLGTDAMAATTAALNYEIIVYYMITSFSQTCVTFTGQNYGAGNISRCRRTARLSMLMGIIFTSVISLAFIIFAEPALRLFSSDPRVIALGTIRIRYIIGLEVMCVVYEVISGALRGFGYSMMPALITCLGVCVFRVAWVYTVFPHHRSLSTLVYSYPISWFLTAAILLLVYPVIIRRIENSPETVMRR